MASETVKIAKTRLVIDGSEVKNTVKDLNTTARSLRKEMAGLEKGTDDYVKASQNLNKVEKRLAEVRGEIKDVGKEWKKQQQDFKKGIGDMVGNINIFGVRVGDVISKIGLLNKTITGTSKVLKILKMALISSGIGAILVAIGSLLAYLSRMQEGIEFVNKLWAAFNAALDVIIDRVASFGKGLFQIFSGKFKDGWQTMKQSLQGIGEEIKNETVLAWNLQEALDALIKLETDHSLAVARRKKQIQELLLITRDETVSYEKRHEALQRANELELSNLREGLELQRERVRIAQEDYDRAESTEEDRKALIAERVKLEDLETQSLARQREILNRVNELRNKEIADIKKQKEEQMKLWGEFTDFQEIETERRIKNAIREQEERNKILVKGFDDEIEKQRQTAEKKKQIDRQYADAKIAMENEVFMASKDVLGGTISLLAQDEASRKKNAEAIKTFSISNVVADLAQEIQAIWKWANSNPANLLFPGAGNIIAAVKTVAAGLRAKMAISNINAQSFDGGGYTGPGFGAPDESGFKPSGIVHEHEYVIPKWITQSDWAKPMISYLESKRLQGYADGGMVVPQPDASGFENTFSKMAGMIPQKIEAFISYDKLEGSRSEMASIKKQRSI